MFGSLGKAQSDGFGIYSGWPTVLGVQFQTGDLRLGAGLATFGFGGDVGLILAESPIPRGDLSWYYGLGAGLGLWRVGLVSGVNVFPHGLVGLEWRVPQADFSLYVESQLGVNFFLGNGAFLTTPGFSGRLGIIFRP
jgi:hypothetical protein